MSSSKTVRPLTRMRAHNARSRACTRRHNKYQLYNYKYLYTEDSFSSLRSENTSGFASRSSKNPDQSPSVFASLPQLTCPRCETGLAPCRNRHGWCGLPSSLTVCVARRISELIAARFCAVAALRRINVLYFALRGTVEARNAPLGIRVAFSTVRRSTGQFWAIWR